MYYKDYASIGRNNSYLNKLIVGAHLYNTFKYVDQNYLSSPRAFVTMRQDAKIIKTGNKILSLHMIGSHGPTYWQRYPKNMSVFEPACNRSDIENCSDEQIVNTYDNTIRYTDYITASVIEKLKNYQEDYNTAVIYISDHGESLGENGLFLHGTPYKLAPEEQTKVPLMMWFSDSFKQNNRINDKCLQQNAKTVAYSHDNLFHSLLGLMNVSTSLYNKELDIFSNCRT